MRWEFADQSDASAQNAVIARIDAWWSEFARRSDDICAHFSRAKEWDLPAWMEQHLSAIHPKLMWEYGPAIRGSGDRLVITSESKAYLRPLVRKVLSRAPNLHNWEFYPFRLPEDVETMTGWVQARTDVKLDGQTRVFIKGGSMRRIDLLFESPTCKAADDRPARDAVFVATESLLGEDILNKWIGGINVDPSERPKTDGRDKPEPRFIPLERLKPTVDALIASMTDQIGDFPHYIDAPTDPDDDQRKWSSFNGKPAETDDFARWSDLIAAVSPYPNLWPAAHNDPEFYSLRYSAIGERFCYLKIDGSNIDGMTFEDRADMENALNAALIPAKAGCTIGGGTGVRYTYIDLALANLQPAIKIIRQVMREGKIPRRTWLLFYDCEWGDEWIGIWSDTPAPPMPKRDTD